ncbi:hypothetical protein CEXT_58681 [Caerostris extrusa]|uniref:Uncharacterized protein n=1 Tax=Caerostris extrusa TaxID=172846 RepID=A0AAV4MEB1_CAEEX|nr:hypothetical protein CEXT_58681 [Caerostris extrusa]
MRKYGFIAYYCKFSVSLPAEIRPLAKAWAIPPAPINPILIFKPLNEEINQPTSRAAGFVSQKTQESKRRSRKTRDISTIEMRVL